MSAYAMVWKPRLVAGMDGVEWLVGRTSEDTYRDEKKSLQILLSSTQAGPGRKVKQEQEDISRNHVPRHFLDPVLQYYFLDGRDLSHSHLKTVYAIRSACFVGHTVADLP